MVVKKLKQKKNLKQKQKQKQKQNVKVSQNVKVVVGDLKTKTKRAKKSSSGAGKKQSQEKQSISLNIINPYQQLLPSPPQAQAQAQAQAPPVANTNPRNPANPNIVRQLSVLNDQNANIRNDLRDLREFAKNQQQSYNYLLKAQKNEVPAESKTSKIEKMLKNKKLIMASMNWDKLLDNEDKSEALILKEEKQAPVKFADPTDPILVRPNPILQRPIGPMPVAEPKPQRSLLSSWFSNIDWGNVIRESVDTFAPLLSSIQEQQEQEYEGIEEQKQEPNYLTLMGPRRLLIEEPNEPEPAIPQFRFEELLEEAKEEEGESEVKEQEPAQPAQISKRAQKRREYYRRRSEKKKQEAEGAGAGPPVIRRGRPLGSRNRPREVIQQEKREKENKKQNKK